MKNFHKKGEYIKIDTLYKNHIWYSTKLYKIKKIKLNTSRIEEYYITSNNGKTYEWNYSLMFQDKECLILNRKEKLKKLQSNEL